MLFLMRIFGPEHKNTLRSLYGEDAAEAEALLESFSVVLEKQVMRLSLALDEGKGDIRETRKVLFEQGLCRIPHESSFGGMGLPFGIYAMAMELAGAADAGTAMSLGIHNTVADAVAKFGSPTQKGRFLPKLLSGEMLAAFALTEPTSGSDARSMRTKATREGKDFVLDGSKVFITNAGEADLYLVFASTPKGHGAFLVGSSNRGLKVGLELKHKLGMRGTRTAEVRLERCKVSAEESLLGSDEGGFEYAKTLLDSSRIVMGMICVGVATTAYAKALDYTKGRTLFGKNLSDFQMTRERFANAVIEMNAARLLCMHAARLKERNQSFTSEAAQAKVLATEMATRTCDAAIQLLGGYGYTTDDVHRHWRDARLLTIGEGASEVLRMIIASNELDRVR